MRDMAAVAEAKRLGRQRADQLQPGHPGAREPRDRQPAGLGHRPRGGRAALPLRSPRLPVFLLAISSAVSHDLIKGQLNPSISEKGASFCPRGSPWPCPSWSATLARDQSAGLRGADGALAFGLAAASIFPALMMGIFFHRKINNHGAVAGMIAGLTVTVVYIFLHKGWFFIPGTKLLQRMPILSSATIQSTSFGAPVGGGGQTSRWPYLVASMTKETPKGYP